jgi:hypothetical protein
MSSPKELSFLEQERLEAEQYEAEQAAAKAVTEPAALPAGTDPAVLALLQSQAQTNQRLTAALEAIAGRAETGPTPQIPFAQAKFQTPWNPTGEPYKVELSRPTWINGHRLRELLLSQEEIVKLNKLRAGKYHDRKWIVVESDGDSGESSSMVSLFFPNKTPEQKIDLARTLGGRGLVALLDMILEEADRITLAA